MLPDGIGFDVAERFKARFDAAPVLYISGYPSEHFSNRIKDCPGEFLAKPFQISELKERVSAMVENLPTVEAPFTSKPMN